MSKKERFDANWVEVDGCWEWTGSTKTRNGETRGRIMLDGERKNAAHWAWILYRGEISKGFQINHHCDNPLCVNPEHLYEGSQKENVEDISRRGRWPIRTGESNNNSKLCEKSVREIREMSGVSNRSLAAEYGVSSAMIGLIRNGKAWTHLNDEGRKVG